MPKFQPKQPGEILTMCDGYKPIRDANRLLKKHGLVLKTRGNRASMGDQVYLRLEKVWDSEDIMLSIAGSSGRVYATR